MRLPAPLAIIPALLLCSAGFCQRANSQTRPAKKIPDATVSGKVTGRVVLEESKAPECKGKRRVLFAETVISSWHNEKIAVKDQPQFPWGLGGPVLPNQQGDFALRNLAPGEYRFI